MRLRVFGSLLAIVFVAGSAFNAYSDSRAELVRDAVSTNEAQRADAIAGLRAMGADGLDALFEGYSREIADFVRTNDDSEDWKRIAAALDSVAMQKDSYAARLFWHTDLAPALAEAKRTGKSVLSLRLLGNLNEEFSCANSRFFRALLYSNTAIASYLRENYVLHWKSVRPAPKVTIDFGDGRKIERTLTGNSIHYILSPNGEVIDALPGLYDPRAFLGYLTKARDLSARIANLAAPQRASTLNGYRRSQFFALRAKRVQAIEKAGVTLKETQPAGERAIEVAPIAVTKMVTEVSILSDLDDNFSRFEPQIPSDDWKKLAAIYAGDAKFDESSLAFVRRQNRGLNETQFKSMIAKLAVYVALDTTRNDFLLHMQLLQRLNNDRKLDLERFNSAVYNDLFKTPDADKWLGLYTDDVYTALDGNGVRF